MFETQIEFFSWHVLDPQLLWNAGSWRNVGPLLLFRCSRGASVQMGSMRAQFVVFPTMPCCLPDTSGTDSPLLEIIRLVSLFSCSWVACLHPRKPLSGPSKWWHPSLKSLNSFLKLQPVSLLDGAEVLLQTKLLKLCRSPGLWASRWNCSFNDGLQVTLLSMSQLHSTGLICWFSSDNLGPIMCLLGPRVRNPNSSNIPGSSTHLRFNLSNEHYQCLLHFL